MGAGAEAETGEGRSWTRAQKWTIVAAGLGVFITLHDVLVANVALPRIQAFYDLGESGLQWIVATYSMGMAIAIMPAATVADRFGRRRLYLTAVVVFIVASVTAGLTSTFTVMLVARGIQGVAAAVITVSALALVSATFPQKRQRFFALGLFAAVADIGLALGPPLGGILTEAASWRVVFTSSAADQRRLAVTGCASGQPTFPDGVTEQLPGGDGERAHRVPVGQEAQPARHAVGRNKRIRQHRERQAQRHQRIGDLVVLHRQAHIDAHPAQPFCAQVPPGLRCAVGVLRYVECRCFRGRLCWGATLMMDWCGIEKALAATGG